MCSSTTSCLLVPERLDVAIVGAGPFGLFVVAWLDDLRTYVYGVAVVLRRAPSGAHR